MLTRDIQGTYSDEMSAQNKPNSGNPWIFRLPKDKWKPANVNLQAHVKPTLVLMVFGTIWKGGRSPLVVLERDEFAARNGFTARSYIQALEEALLPEYRPGTFFQQDNARIHTARATKEFLEAHGIWTIDWPSHSPDLNPIEHVWKRMKELLYEAHPELHTLRNNEVDRALLARWLDDAWWAVEQDLIDRLVDSVPRRLRAVRRARGWYTKY